MIEMKVSGIVLDPQSKTPILVLRDMDDRRALLIWIGSPEANAIILSLEKIKLNRPSTHDLFLSMLNATKCEFKSITIYDMKESTYFASLNVIQNGKNITIDSRPSDAVAIALRAGVGIFVSEQVMAESSIPIDQNRDEEEAKKFKDFIQSVKPSDFFRS
ncbi:MAG: bifunctional nuclease family protein [Candidatus Sericytochromatia bacterium]